MSCRRGEVSGVMGVALDGFPIYGPMQWWSPSEELIYINPENCGDCVLRQLGNSEVDQDWSKIWIIPFKFKIISNLVFFCSQLKCGGRRTADGSEADGTTYRYIYQGSLCYRGDLSLAQRRQGNSWTTFQVGNGCGINSTGNDGTW